MSCMVERRVLFSCKKNWHTGCLKHIIRQGRLASGFNGGRVRHELSE
jgi:hypothetical protein